jgi:hypothetical protein
MWAVTVCGPQDLLQKLREGWEPYAVAFTGGECSHWLKRQVRPAGEIK